MNTMTDLGQDYRTLREAHLFLESEIEMALRSLPYAVAAPTIIAAKEIAARLEKMTDDILHSGDDGYTIKRERNVPLPPKGFAPELFRSEA